MKLDMKNTITGNAKQIIKATTALSFLEQLDAHGAKLNIGHMAYLGLVGDGAVLDVIENFEEISGLKVGEKREIKMSLETKAANPALVSSIHLVGSDLVVNGSENLFKFSQAEVLLRGIGIWMVKHDVKNVIFGGSTVGLGAWLMPKVGAPICLSTFGLASVLPFEGNLVARDMNTSVCSYLTVEKLTLGQVERQYWTPFFTPTAGVTVVNFGQRVRAGMLYATIRTGLVVSVEAWDLKPILTGGKLITNVTSLVNELPLGVSADLVGPLAIDTAIAYMSSDNTGLTFFGVKSPVVSA